MEFWSKGLGRRSLILALGEEQVEADEEQVALSGKARAPVTWSYIMYLGRSDWTEFFEVALRPEIGSYLLCQRRLGALARLTAFLMKFVALYASALVRVRLGLAKGLGGVTFAPDLGARADIDPAALADLESRGPRSMRRPRPRRDRSDASSRKPEV
jgi:hypothetical protein